MKREKMSDKQSSLKELKMLIGHGPMSDGPIRLIVVNNHATFINNGKEERVTERLF